VTASEPGHAKILERQFEQYGKARYERLARISAAHIYNVCKSRAILTQLTGLFELIDSGGARWMGYPY
jgi:hypothetical protein